MENKTIKQRGIEIKDSVLDDAQKGFTDWSEKKTGEIVGKLLDSAVDGAVPKIKKAFDNNKCKNTDRISRQELERILKEELPKAIKPAYKQGFEAGLNAFDPKTLNALIGSIREDDYIRHLIALQNYGMTYEKAVEVLNSNVEIWEEDYRTFGRRRNNWEIFETKQLEFDKRDGTLNLKVINQKLEEAKLNANKSMPTVKEANDKHDFD